MRFFTKKGWLKFHEREKKEFGKVEKMTKEKDKIGLEKWLKKFSVEGDFWRKPEREKFKKDDWL